MVDQVIQTNCPTEEIFNIWVRYKTYLKNIKAPRGNEKSSGQELARQWKFKEVSLARGPTYALGAFANLKEMAKRLNYSFGDLTRLEE